jgi:hypothetical protein
MVYMLLNYNNYKYLFIYLYLLSPWYLQPYGFLHSNWAPTLTLT